MSLAKCWHDSFALVRPSRKMETGRSMERMWLCLKPQVPPTFSGLEQLWRLERLSERFDSLIFQGFMPLTQLVELRKLFAASLQGFAKNNVSSDDLSLQLQQGLESLERSASKNSSELIPHFHSIYELLTQRVGIDGHHESPTLLPMLEMLATRPTRLSAPHADNSEQQYLQRIPIECERDSVCIIKDDVCERILGQL